MSLSSLDELKRSAEYLERGRSSASSTSINILNIGKFFEALGNDNLNSSSLEGRLLLAQKGVDSAKSEKLINEIFQKVSVKRSEQSKKTKLQTSQKFNLHIPRTALEQVEYMRFQRVDDIWHDMLNGTLETIGMLPPKEVIRKRPFDIKKEHDSSLLFRNKPGNLLSNSIRAKIYAQHMSDFTNGLQVAIDVLSSLDEIASKDEPTSKIQISFFKAFKEIFSSQSLIDLMEKNHSSVGNVITQPEGIRAMANGSIKFMQDSYKDQYFKEDQSLDAVDNYCTTNFPNAQAPWIQLWVAIRSGLYDLVPQICRRNARETQDFLAAFNSHVLEGIDPTPEERVRLCGDSSSLYDDPFKQQVLCFTVGSEIRAQSDVIQTAEDYVFSVLNPFRFSSNDGVYDTIALSNIQETVMKEAQIAFADQKETFILPLILLLSLNFTDCGNALLDCKVFPCEVVHAIIALKAWELWDPSEYFTLLINDFVHLLPPQMCGRAIDYLAFTGNHKVLCDYLLELDAYDESISVKDESSQIHAELLLEGRPSATALIQQEVETEGPCERTFHILLISNDLEAAYKMLILLDQDYSVLTLQEVCSMVKNVSVLIAKLIKAEFDPLKIKIVHHSAFKLSEIALAQSEQLGLAQREELINSCKMFMKTCFSDLPEEVQAVNSLRSLIHIVSIMSLLDAGNAKGAIEAAKQSPHIIPIDENSYAKSVAWIQTQPTSIGFALKKLIINVFKKLVSLVDEDSQHISCVQTLARFSEQLSDDLISELSARDLFNEPIDA